MATINPLEKYDFGYFDLNPDYDSSIKIINKKTVIQGNGAAYYFGEIQVYDELDCSSNRGRNKSRIRKVDKGFRV